MFNKLNEVIFILEERNINVKVYKINVSSVITIPKEIAEALKIKEGENLNIIIRKKISD